MAWQLGDLLGLNKGKATIDAAEKNRGLISGLDTKGTGIIDSAYTGTKGYLDDARSLTDLGSLYTDALGGGGAEGAARARGAFEAGPGYQFELDQGLQALDRRRAATGSWNSGGADLDTLEYAQGTARKGWNDWLDRVTGATDRTIGSIGSLAQLEDTTGQRRLGFAGDIATAGMGANNQVAAGTESNKDAWGSLGKSLISLAGTAIGGGIPMPFGGGGGTPLGYGKFF